MISYFAYGSNLDEGQMIARCPSAKRMGKYVLPGYELAFTIFSPKRQCGCADVIKNPNREVWGIVYEITEEDLVKLDEFESHPNKYRRFTTNVYDDKGQERTVETYEVVEKSSTHLIPSVEYYNIISDAAKRYKFPESYCNFIKSFTVSK